MPDTFKDGAQSLVEGHAMPDGRFVAEQVQAKCASKYEAAPGQGNYGIAADQSPAKTTRVSGSGVVRWTCLDRTLCCWPFCAVSTRSSAGIAAIITRKPLLIKSARNAGMAVCVLVWLGFASLAYLFLTDNFSMAYVVEHSNRTLPTFFKFAAIWSGQQGSLLFWSFLLSIYVFSALFAYRGKHPELMPYVGVVLAGVQLFFLTLNNFVASPFQVWARRAPTARCNGSRAATARASIRCCNIRKW